MADDGPPQTTTPTPSAGPRRIAGFTVKEYEARVWDMARHVLHPSGLYVLAVVAGASRLLQSPIADEPGSGAWIEFAIFLAAFLGAWACVFSTLLREAGLTSLTVTLLVPLAVLAAVAVWTVFPAPEMMTGKVFAAGAALLVAPAPPAWVLTMIRWRRHRAEQAEILREAGL
ncbi:MAG: hypothetical protein K8T90_13965 [Planctomycetes bacterium]|nr:hypothetical protein [Planctomycetota bacterium]